MNFDREFTPNVLETKPSPQEVPVLSLIAAGTLRMIEEPEHAEIIRTLMKRALVVRDRYSKLRLTKEGAFALFELGLPFGEPDPDDDNWAVCTVHGAPTGKNYGSGKPRPCQICERGA